MVLIIYTKNESNLPNRYGGMIQNGQTEWMNDAKTLLGDKKGHNPVKILPMISKFVYDLY